MFKPPNITKLLIVLFAFLILAGLLFYGYKTQQKEYKASPTPQPQSLSPRAQEIKKAITKTDQKEGDLTSDYPEYTIDYLISNDQYIVTIKQAPFKENKKKAESWFLNQGFEPQDLCALKITFVAAKEVPKNYTLEETVPEGCI